MRRSSNRTVLGLLLLLLLPPGCGGTDERDGETGPEEGPPVREQKDYWLERYGPYMTEEFREKYLATREEERFRVHGESLQEFQRREELLSRAKGKLTEDQLEEYRRLPDLDACRAYLQAHAGGIGE